MPSITGSFPAGLFAAISWFAKHGRGIGIADAYFHPLIINFLVFSKYYIDIYWRVY
jgi:hypothetical protein